MVRVLRHPLVAGNWKMNGLRSSVAEFDKITKNCGDLSSKVDLMVCPPATLLCALAKAAAGSKVVIGAQDCHPERSGAHTGDLSAEMLCEAGAVAVIVGHSERRTDHNETDAIVRAKALAARLAGLTAIVCVGETRVQREAGKTLDVLGRQLDGSLPADTTDGNLVVAYEPVWAIGTGLTPSRADVAEAHRFIRERLVSRFGTQGDAIRILYGGSVKPINAGELMQIDNVDGALVGGASLKADEFLAIAAVYGTANGRQATDGGSR
jgi:triosephosphate isomerase (TIM)